MKNVNYMNKLNKLNEKVVDYLVFLVVSVLGVNDVIVVVVGKYVIVGIDVKVKFDWIWVELIKYFVVESLKNDFDGVNVVVVVDVDMYECFK